MILSTDEIRFGGAGLIAHDYVYRTDRDRDGGIGFNIYVPARTAMVLQKV